MNLEPYLRRWNALEGRVRASLIAAGIAVAIVAFAVALLSRDTRVPLFANALKADQVAEVDAELSSWNVPFLPTHDNVRVDGHKRAELLARLAIAGVPHAHVVGTAEALATVGTLTPQAILDAQAREGLEGDLEKGLRGLGGIGEARVIIAPAKAGVFADEVPTPATASVRLSAAPGAVLTSSTLNAVRAFVASGVPGLDAAHVTVVDDRGAFDDRADDARERESAVQSALDAAFGAGTTIVRVHVDRAQGSTESRDEHRDPDNRAIQRRDLDEHFSGDKKSYTRRQTTEERGSDLHQRRTVIAAGSIARVSVAVIVDARRNLDLTKIRDAAAAASGYEPGRGDTLSVDAVPFERPYGARPAAFAYAAGAAVDVLPVIAIAIVLVVAIRAGAAPLAAFAREFSRRNRFAKSPPHFPSLEAERIFQALRDEPPHVVAAIVATLNTPLAAAVLDFYGADERRAIVHRLARKPTPLLAQLKETLLDGR